MSPDPLLSRDTEELARFARVEPPAELDAWVRARLRAAVAERAHHARVDVMSGAPAHDDSGLRARSGEPMRTATPRVPASMPLAERLALAVGAVACGVQASGFVLRAVWNVLSLGR
jgi:hypothetical protein